MAKAWVAVSEDSVAGTDMKADDFWSGIHRVFVTKLMNERKFGSARSRDQVALRSRWQRQLNKATQYFCSVYNRVEYNSGFTDQDYIQEALRRYKLTKNNQVYSLLEDTP